MGLAEWFNDFCGNLVVQDGGTISSRYKAITRRLNTDFWATTSDTAHSLYVGSYGRNTAVQGFSDLDMVFELPSKLYYQYDRHAGNGQSALLHVGGGEKGGQFGGGEGASGAVTLWPFWPLQCPSRGLCSFSEWGPV